jgi:hypothetical protein
MHNNNNCCRKYSIQPVQVTTNSGGVFEINLADQEYNVLTNIAPNPGATGMYSIMALQAPNYENVNGVFMTLSQGYGMSLEEIYESRATRLSGASHFLSENTQGQPVIETTFYVMVVIWKS